MKSFNIEVVGSDCHYLIDVSKRLSVILGDSSTGKTFLIKVLRKKTTKVISRFKVRWIDQTENFNIYTNTCFLIDLDSDNALDIIKCTNKVDVVTNNLYFIYLGRGSIKSLPLSIDSIYEFKQVKGITRNVQRYTPEMSYIINDKVSSFVTEDSKSGLEFIKACEPNTWSLDGASNYRKLSNENLAFIDALGFGGYIEEFLYYAKLHNIQFIMWKSFEYFLYHNVFNGDDSIIDGYNIEQEYTKALNAITYGHYSKSNNCCGDACYKCENLCKHTNCKDILYSVYPELKDKIDTHNDTLNQIINMMAGR